MFTKTIGNVTIHFMPLIITGIVMAIILLVQILRVISWIIRIRRINKDIFTGNYDNVIKMGEPLLHIYQKCQSRYRRPESFDAVINSLHFFLSVSYFSKTDDEQFLSHINAITQLNDHREIWLALFYLRKDDFENVELHYNKININDETYVARTFLEAWKYDKQGEHDLAKEKMNSIYADLKHIVLKNIADEILS